MTHRLVFKHVLVLIQACLSASVQLQCDKKKITAHVGGEFTLKCDYNTKSFLFSKKYWCRGPSGHTCVIVMDSEQVHKSSDRTHILDTPRYGLFVKVTQLQFEDAGTYWVGIDKIYADIMTSVVKVNITVSPVMTSAESRARSSQCRLWYLQTATASTLLTWRVRREKMLHWLLSLNIKATTYYPISV
uniref:Immunoglobulin V-set domain-containing protein n=1 Tax=Echeneis naucrates TaxID=173247 RepID=A0A665V1N6_ECHNA